MFSGGIVWRGGQKAVVRIAPQLCMVSDFFFGSAEAFSALELFSFGTVWPECLLR